MRGAATPFPGTYVEIPTTHLREVYRRGPERLRTALRGLTLEELRARPRPGGGWSALEIAVHVADSEVIGATRVRLVAAHPGSPLPGYDQDVLAQACGYQASTETELKNALDLFATLRRTTERLFERAAPGDWTRTGHHPEYGAVTLRNLLELYADHGERHVEQILEIRRLLDRPVHVPPVLATRLY